VPLRINEEYRFKLLREIHIASAQKGLNIKMSIIESWANGNFDLLFD
jgi:hypothetical protein